MYFSTELFLKVIILRAGAVLQQVPGLAIQGAAELVSVCWDDESLCLKGSSKVVKNDDYQIFIYVPDGYKPTDGQVIDNILTLKPDNSENKTVNWKVSFTQNI